MSATAHIAACWSGQTSWTVLDTGFADGHSFLQIWQSWRAHARRPELLHYVGVLSVAQAAALPAATVEAITQPGLVLEPGFHRILLEDGQLSLTLCVGDALELLPRQEMQADCVLAAAHDWDKWQLKALARCCRRGAQVVFGGAVLPTAALLKEAGFVEAASKASSEVDGEPAIAPRHLLAVYQPHWPARRPRTTGSSSSAETTTPGRCAVIGSGLAGVSVAQALARRGWNVDVYEAQGQSAAGASGLPLGLVVPHHSVDDSPRSRLSRAGTRLMLSHAERLLRSGQDWQLSGVMERDISDDGELSGTPDRWHPYAAWIKPRQLIQRWLQHPRIRLHTNSAVHGLELLHTKATTQWQLRNAQGQELGQANHVVFANAHACVELVQRLATTLPADFSWLADVLNKLQAMQVLHGTLSTGAMPATATQPAFPAFPVNGHGSFVSNIPADNGPRWYAGSTFQTDTAVHADLASEHSINSAKLQTLLPDVAQALSEQFAKAQVQAWQGSRCINYDRMPLVGPLQDSQHTEAGPTLWLCAGMGARGLSFSALCAELLAAWMGHEPLPVENTLARTLSTARVRRKRPAASS